MPIIAHSPLPSYDVLRTQGETILPLDVALRQDIRELHIGLLNMMPDAAFQITEQQFIRLLGSANQIVQIHVHPFTVPGLTRGPEIQRYIDTYYEPFERLREEGLDGLIVSGANVTNPALDLESFWGPLQEVIGWASRHTTSVLCSCLATHALVKLFHGVERRPLLSKRWGVYPHRVVRPDHPLMHGANSRFDVPHSRWNEISSAQLEKAGVQVLVESLDGDFHLGTSPDGIRFVYLQGHPEYDRTSLLKEYKREVARYLRGELRAVPPYPENYLPPEAARIARRYLEDTLAPGQVGDRVPDFPEARIQPLLDNTWTDTGKVIFNNWLGLVYRLTDVRRGVPFVSGVDPEDPLDLRSSSRS
jgi:homoserine O-succinyltransferase/O-acetyltransferase